MDREKKAPAATRAHNKIQQKQCITFSRVTSARPALLTKYLTLRDGALQKESCAQLIDGEIERVHVSSASDFAAVLSALRPDQALIYGVPDAAKTRLLSRREFEKQSRPADAVTRTADKFQWPDSAGVLCVDYDPQPGQRALTKQELLDALCSAVPEIAECAHVWWCSSSSLIYHGPEQLAGIKGQRVYLLVKDATDIPRSGEVLTQRLWLAGHGYYAVSRAGTALARTLADGAVWQTNRLDFAAGAKCRAPLEQRRGDPEPVDGPLLDTRLALPDLEADEIDAVKAAQAAARDAVDDEAKATRQKYIETEARNLIQRAGEKPTDENIRTAENIIGRACSQNVLSGNFVVTLDDGEAVTVAKLLDAPSAYHGRKTRDPLEPEYDGGRVVGKLYLVTGRPNLHSMAHGGRNFRLIRQPRRIEHEKGLTTDTTARTLELLRAIPDVFDMESELVQVVDSSARRLSIHSLAFWLGGVAQFYTWARMPSGDVYEKLLDPPQQVLNQLLALGAGRKLKPLKAVINAPVIDESDRVLARVGYDEKTQLYLDASSEPPAVPDTVDSARARDALAVLMEPFADFATVSAADRGVLLAAILTAIQRPILPTAPAFGLDAPVQGTGKTFLAQCLGALATGEVPRACPHVSSRDDEETRKRLTAILAEGDRVILWDNVLGHFDSAAIAAFLTAPNYSDRILGKSETATFPNRALFLLTGNNLTLAGDMPRRVLKCRLDSRVENPAARKFRGKPLYFILENRQRLVHAGLTLIRGYLQSDAFRAGGAVPDESTASFESWDDLVRQPAAWVSKHLAPDDYADPGDAIRDAVATDPEKETLAEMLTHIEALMGGAWFSSSELYARLAAAPGYAGTATRDARNELAAALEELTAGGRLTKKGLGRILSYRKDRIADGRYLAADNRGGRLRFRIATQDDQKMIKNAV